MNRTDGKDAVLVRASTEFISCFARFVSDCELFDKSEANDEALMCVQENRPWEHSAVHRQWRQALKQVGKLVAHTKAGARGKLRVLRCCFENGLDTDEDVMVLVKSLILDLDRVLYHDLDCPCLLLPVE